MYRTGPPAYGTELYPLLRSDAGLEGLIRLGRTIREQREECEKADKDRAADRQKKRGATCKFKKNMYKLSVLERRNGYVFPSDKARHVNFAEKVTRTYVDLMDSKNVLSFTEPVVGTPKRIKELSAEEVMAVIASDHPEVEAEADEGEEHGKKQSVLKGMSLAELNVDRHL